MRRFYFLVLLSLATALGIHAQAPDTTLRRGLVFDDGAYNAVPRQSRFAGSKGAELPVAVSLKKWCPIPGDQGHIGSCVGWSSCYGALTIMLAQKNKLADRQQITAQAHSALFAYNLTKQGAVSCDGGTMFPDLLEVLKRSGSCYHHSFDVQSCAVVPDGKLQKEAAPFAIKDYQSLFATTDEGDLKIQKVKQSLAEQKPVVIGLALKYNFMDVKQADPVWHPTQGLTMFAGGHAMVVIGYDDGKGAFELMNSWGEKWGDKGFGWVKYEDFGTYCKYGFQLAIDEGKISPEEQQELKGDFVFQYLTKGAGLNFLPAKIAWNDNEGYYETVKHDWKKDQLFQLVASSMAKDQYLYVFSVDAEQKVNEHFPRTMKNTSSFGFNETPLITVTGAQVIVPSPESALSIGKAGTDWLVVLFSKRKIDDYEDFISRIQGSSGEDVPRRMRRFFRGRIAAPADVTYNPDKMSFSFKGSDDAIVAVVLKVDSID